MRLGGAEKQLALLAAELVQRGWHVEILSLEDSDPAHDTVVTSAVRIHSGGWKSTWPWWLKILALVRAQWRLCWLAIRLRPDVLHAVLPLTNFMGAVSGRITLRQCVITSRRALGTHQDKNRLWLLIDRIAGRLSHYVVANSGAVAADTRVRDGLDPAKLRVIYNGIDVAPFESAFCRRDAMRATLGFSVSTIVIGCPSNLIAYKGHRELLTAFANVLASGVPSSDSLILLLAGEDRGIGKSLWKLAQDLKVADRIRYVGPRDDIPDLLSVLDIGALPSHEEGFSNALIEMLAAGLPVVATDVGGNREALEGMAGCCLVPPKNPGAFAAALCDVISTLPERERQRFSRVEAIRRRFPVSKMVEQYVDLYHGRQ